MIEVSETEQRIQRRGKSHKIIQENFLELQIRLFKLKEPVKCNLFCYNACLENTHLFHHNLYVRKQFDHNAQFTVYLCSCPQEILGKRKKLHLLKPRDLNTHTHTPQPYTSYATLSWLQYKIVFCHSSSEC